MAVTLSRYLRLRIDSNLTANARYNLERLDLLGATFITDTTSNLGIRSESDITIEPQSADLGGTGEGGNVTVGNTSHEIESFRVYASEVSFSDPVGTLDQASGGTKYLRLRYKSDLNGSVDTTADRTLSVDLDGSDRSLILGGNLSTTGGNLSLTLSGASSLTLPTTGTLATLAGTEVLTNKTISAASNTITNLTNSSIDASAAISYSKLNLSGSVVNADISNSAAIAYSKLNLTGGVLDTDVSPSAAIARSKIAAGTASHVLVNDGSGNLSSEATLAVSRGGTGAATANTALNNLLPDQTGNSGKVLATDGSDTSWVAVGVGSVTSVALTAPAEFSVAGSPITASGTLAISKATQSANTVWAGPTTGVATQPSFRSLVAADIPSAIPATSIGAGSVDNTEFGYLDGVTSSIQTQLNTKVTNTRSISTTAPLTGGGDLSADRTLSIPKATSLVDGYLASADFTTFSGKQDAGNYITALTGDVTASGPGSVAATIANLAVTNAKIADATIDLTAKVTGVLPVANGGTNSSTSLSNNRVMQSSSGSIVEAAAITASRALVSDVNGIPTHSSVTTTELEYVSGVTSGIQSQLDGKQPLDGDLTALAALSSTGLIARTASNTYALRTITAGTGISVSDGDGVSGNPTISVSNPTVSFKDHWLTADGTTKTVTHNLGSTDILVQVFDEDNGETIQVDTEIRTNSNTLALTSSQAPANSWRVLILSI